MNDMFVRLVITSSRSCCTLRIRRRLRGNRRRLFRSRRMAMYQGRPLWPRRAARSDFLDRHDAFHRTHEIPGSGLTGADVWCSKANVAAGGCRISQAERYELLRYLSSLSGYPMLNALPVAAKSVRTVGRDWRQTSHLLSRTSHVALVCLSLKRDRDLGQTISL